LSKRKTEGSVSVKAERISKWFAMGFGQAEKKLPRGGLLSIPTQNPWQKEELVRGYDASEKGGSHIQFWMVEGEFTHEEMEKLIKEKK
jgi:hypothetical protein